MEEMYKCVEEIREHKNNQDKMISMSKIYSISSLGNKNVIDYLKSFSQSNMEIKKSFKCFNHLKQKCESRHKCYKYIKPYSKNRPGGSPFETISCTQNVLVPSKSNFPSTEVEAKAENQNTNMKSLRVINPDGSTTEVTLRPVVLMHVREIPPETEVDKSYENQEDVMQPRILPHVGDYANVPSDISNPQTQVDCENETSANILRVKSSRNCTNFPSERKQSSTRVSKNSLLAPDNFKKPSLHLSAENCIKLKMSSINCPTSPIACPYGHGSIPDFNRCLGSLLDHSIDNNIMIISSEEYARHFYGGGPKPSFTTFFHNQEPRPSSSFSGYAERSHEPIRSKIGGELTE